MDIKKIFSKLSFLLSFLLTLSACGGGGGGGSDNASRVSATPSSSKFTSWDKITEGTTSFEGISYAGSYRANLSSDRVTQVNSVAYSENAGADLTYQSCGNNLLCLTRASLQTPNDTVTWNTNAGDTIERSSIISGLTIAYSSNLEELALASEPLILEHNYNEFGVWLTGVNTGSGRFGALSLGSKTNPANVPINNSANFFGLVMGMAIDQFGNYALAGADLRVAASFSNRTLDFYSSNTLLSEDTINFIYYPGYNLRGRLTYSNNSSNFSGNLFVSGSDLIGPAKGRFYGPSANEIGGVFDLRGSGLTRYIGSFGASR